MTAQELKSLYEGYYKEVVESKDPSKMLVLGGVTTRLFNEMADRHPDIAQREVEALEAMGFYNYVTLAEASEIASEFINDDTMITGNVAPSKGAHWNMDALKSFLTQKGLPLEEKPYFNWPALWLTVNMVYSDYANAFVEVLGSKENDKIATASYKFALKKLKDLDRKHFIREYFDLDD